VGADAATLDYDLAISDDPTTPATIADTGVDASQARPVGPDGESVPLWPIALGGLVGLIVIATFLGQGSRRPGPVPA
jgi:hypothetical protein